ncbi:MAG: phosphoribosyltransferase, partial [Candidatus Hecatellales archaeon B24]
MLGFKIKVLGWREVSNLIFKLWNRVKRSGFTPDLVVAVLRGGCLVGLLMADFYGVNLETL